MFNDAFEVHFLIETMHVSDEALSIVNHRKHRVAHQIKAISYFVLQQSL